MPLVVIVDDQITNQRIFARIAAAIEPGIEVETFGDPRTALVFLAGRTPDLIITDYKMPGLNGAEFITRLRASPALADVPVIVLTVFEEWSFRLKALDAGATDFLQSPVDHREFTTRARNLLKMRRQQMELANRADSLARELRLSEHSLEQAIRDSSERLAQVIDTVPAMISATDAEGRFLFMNAYQSALIGADPSGIVGRSAIELLGEEVGHRHKALDRLVMESGKPLHSFEEEVVDRTGAKRTFLTTKSPLRDAGERATGVLTSAIDITDRKLAEKHVLHAAQHDALTGLPNRALLRDRLRREVTRARRGDRRFALHLLDLDGFKGVNDLVGHAGGDKLLKAVAARLRGLAREGDVVARLGGDEFAILQTDVTGDDAALLAARIREAVAEPRSICGERVTATASIGVTLHPNDGADFEELFRHADLAMYRAKGAGGNQHRFFAADMDARARQAAALDADLRRALVHEQFVLHYQPQVSLATGRIVGVEALLRWRQADGRIIGPGQFLPRAEENGFIVPINEWVIREACGQLVAWQRAGLPPLRMGVNLSPVQLQRQSVPLLVARILGEMSLDPRLLDLELTESTVTQDAESVALQLRQLRELGVMVSIDDFGTGYSSLSYVKQFPADRLKIDQSFVRDLLTDPSDAAIVRAVINLGHSLGLEVVAEGVETAEQAEHLKAEGCDEVQGYYFGRPMPASEIAALLGPAPVLLRRA